jgi:hypothetical protein
MSIVQGKEYMRVSQESGKFLSIHFKISNYNKRRKKIYENTSTKL